MKKFKVLFDCSARTIVKYFVFLVMDAWIAYRRERKLLQKARYVEFKQIAREMRRSGSYSYCGDIWDDEDDIYIGGFDSYQDLVDAYHKKKLGSQERSGEPNEKPFILHN